MMKQQKLLLLVVSFLLLMTGCRQELDTVSAERKANGIDPGKSEIPNAIKNFKMKTYISTLTLFVIFLSSKAQNIVPWNKSRSDNPDYTYYKDLDNGLPQFVGLWQATLNGKIIKLKIDYVPQKLISSYKTYYQDILIVHYEIKDGQGNIIESDWNESLNSYKIGSVTYNQPNNRVRFG